MSPWGDSATVYCHSMPDEFPYAAAVVLWLVGVVVIVLRKLTTS
jgi:hypothetical protein